MLLALLNAGLASGQNTPRAIADWVQEHAAELLAVLQPSKPRLPSATTLWRILKEVDAAGVEAQIARHNQALDADDAPASQVRATNGAWLQGAGGRRHRAAGHECPRCAALPGEPGASRQRLYLGPRKMCLAKGTRSTRSTAS